MLVGAFILAIVFLVFWVQGLWALRIARRRLRWSRTLIANLVALPALFIVLFVLIAFVAHGWFDPAEMANWLFLGPTLGSAMGLWQAGAGVAWWMMRRKGLPVSITRLTRTFE
ncbi:small-conductance mechanosensitive channel [Novosphingobium sp. SG751A]|uniref:hypothetical protein n=1 Tax=Novosphingobium sp. SG751A TaxID=2587000 RepID=UPI0015532D4E|nr:hypothetical protein [Novosphingobium sp. SG751A]NOW46614.1 small-conductance mechanosensitive channel [Novosphingobium sp. SG751A]